MRRPTGYATIVDPDRPLVEQDTVQCGHCTAVIFVKPGTGATVYLIRGQEEAGAFCRTCMRPICLRCYTRSLTAPVSCVTWERAMEASESRQRLRSAVG